MPYKEITNTSVSYLQILDENGNLDTDLEPKIPESDLLKTYRTMNVSRLADQRMLNLQRQGRLGTFAPCVGQEAAVCGPTLAMRETDWFICAFRELGGRYMRGEPISHAIMTWKGFEEGYVFDSGKRTLPISIVLASQLPIAVGIAYAMRMKGEKETCVLAFFGDGATSEGEFHEALNFASAWQVPVVFICQNNQWAISTPRSIQTHSKTIAQKAFSYDMPGIQVDGNDILAMYKATSDAFTLARSGGGPTLIEAYTYRLWMHTTADDPTKYRDDAEVKYWEKRDPIPRFRIYLEKKKLWNDDKQKQLEDEIKAEIDAAVNEVEAKTDYKPDAAFDFVFENRPKEIEDQREEFLSNLQKEAKENG